MYITRSVLSCIKRINTVNALKFKGELNRVSDSIKSDSFEYSIPESVKNFKVKNKYYKNHNHDSDHILFEDYDVIHKKRLARFKDDTPMPERRYVGRAEYKAMFDIQFEAGEYFDVKAKMRKGEPLNKKEQKFYNRILKSMTKTDKKQILWRMVSPYNGFEEEIKSGKYHLKGLISTSSKYDEFFKFFNCDRFIKDKNGLNVQPSYILKINVPEGTPVLDCNAYTKNIFGQKRYTKMAKEVVLPDSHCIVRNVDNELNVIEMDLIS